METLTDQLLAFWRIIQDVWNTGVMGFSIGNALIALGIFLLFYVLRVAFRRVVLKMVDRWARRKTESRASMINDILSGPLQLGFVTLGLFFAFQYVELGGELETLADNIVRSLISLAIFWALYNAIVPFSELLKKLESFLTREMVEWLITGVKWGVIFLGGATILQVWGIQVAPILAGLGLFGVAVALGAQDLFRNLIGGLCILVEKRFKNGDWIMVDGVVEGTVEHIGFRSTTVRRFDAAPVYVPNQRLSDAAVTNFTEMTYRRIFWKIGLEYRTTIDQLKDIRQAIEDYLRQNEAFVQPPAASMFVRVDSFNSSSIDLMLYTFTKTKVWGEWLQHKEELAYTIKRIVEGAGSGFAFPSQSVYLEKYPEGAPELFIPPAKAA
jgi:MscS family membrane protein